LQEAIGQADLAQFVVRLPDGKLVTFAGPVLSYYEWKRPRREALTQQAWVELLHQTPGPARPEWSR
jgi:hypothetical protein